MALAPEKHVDQSGGSGQAVVAQTDHSPWMDPALSHHESRLKPGDGGAPRGNHGVWFIWMWVKNRYQLEPGK